MAERSRIHQILTIPMIIAIDASRAFLAKTTGTGEYAKELIKELILKNEFLKKHQLILFTQNSNLPKNFLKKLPDNWQIVNINFRYLWTQLALPIYALIYKIDVLLVPSHNLPLINLRNYKKIYVLHGLEFFQAKRSFSFLKRVLNVFFIRQSLQKADRIITLAKVTKQKAIQLFNLKSSKIKVIYPGVKLTKKIKKLKLIKKLKPYLIYVGSLEKRKNLKFLIKIFSELKKDKRFKRYKLVLVGSKGYGYKTLKQVIDKSPFKKAILEFGYIDKFQKETLIENAKALINLSLAEGFSRPILEALKLKTPVIISQIPVFKELYQEFSKNQVCLVKKDDRKEAVEGMQKFLTKPLPKNENFVKINFKYNWDKAADKIIKLLIS
jgi:glycosyltransferase involved in cell wall biosynthesis